MGVYGKQEKAPGYQKVSAEREKWQELKEKYLTYFWFVEVLEDEINSYEEYLRDQPWKDWQEYCKLVWSDKKKKWIYASMNAEERLYWRTLSVGNGMKDIDDYRDVIKIPSWNYESCCVLEDLLSERKKALIYQLYKEEKENKSMGKQDNKPRSRSQKKVRFE
tara:strand:+ start:870 stop:1358 length:489 start_codon:yes stop_codon:yes gene_type:complete